MNDAGVRVLRVSPSSTVLVYPDGRQTPLPNPFGDPRVSGNRINRDGYVTGAAYDPARGVGIPLVWSPDLTDEVELPRLSDRGAYGSAMNLFGDVVGTSVAADGTRHVVLWKHAATIGGLEIVTERYVDNRGVANALLAILDEAARAQNRGDTSARTTALNAYRTLVQAQTGKCITAMHARLLTRLSERL